MASSYSLYSSRIGNSSSPIGWQAACQGDVTDWNKANDVVFAVIIDCSAHTPPSETFKLQWTKDGGLNWYDVGSASPNDDVQVGVSDELNEGDPVGDLSGCAGATPTDSEEDESDNSVTIQVGAKNDYGEVQFALDFANAEDSATYEFRLYSVTESSPLGTCAASLTIASAGVTEKNFSDSVGLSDAFTNPFRAMGFTDSVSAVDVFTIIYKALGFSDSISVADAFSLFQSKGFSDSVSITDVFDKVVTAINKNFADSVNMAEAFNIPFKALEFADAISAVDVFVIPFKELQFADAVTGADSFAVILRMLEFSDSVGVSDVFEKSVLGGVTNVYFSDTVGGSDSFGAKHVHSGKLPIIIGMTLSGELVIALKRDIEVE